MAQIETWYSQDLKKPVPVNNFGVIYNEDSQANKIGVRLFSDGVALQSISGSVTGYFLLADGTTTSISGSKSGNEATVIVPPSAYKIPGPITITVRITDGDSITTVCACVGLIMRAKTPVATPAGSTVADWSAQISAELQACQDAADNLGSIVASAYSTSQTYAVGTYVTNSGNLYRCTTAVTTAGSWASNSSKFTQVKVCDELNNLLSAIQLEAVEHNLITSATRLANKKLDGNGALADSTDYNQYEVFELTYDGSYDTFNATVYGNTNYQVRAVAFYNSSDTVISTLQYPSTSEASTFTNQAIPANTAKIYICNRGTQGTASGSFFTMESLRLDDDEDDIADNTKAIGKINDELDLQDYTVNLLTNATHTDGKKLDENGEVQSVSTYEIYEIAYDGTYEKFSATVHSASNYKLRAISFQDSEGTVLQVLQYSDTSSPYTSTYTDLAIPTGTSKIILANQKDKGGVTATITVKKSKRFIDIEDEIDSISDSLSVFSVSSKNLFDGSTVVGLVYEVNGTIVDTFTTHRASDFIEIEAGTIYTISAHHKDTDAFNIEGLRYAFYASDKTFISGVKADGKCSTFRTPATAKYIRFSMVQTNTEKWQLERRSFATNYVPYNTVALNDESEEMFLNYPQNVYVANGLEYNFYAFNVTPERYAGQFSHDYNESDTKVIDYGRFLRFKDSHTATSEIKVGATFKSHTKCGDKIFTVVPCDQTKLDNVSVLVLGDSTTANGYVVTDLHGYSGNENKITTLGTLGTAPYNHEGRSGWRLNDYFTTSTNNPFYNPSTETFDAEYYFTQTQVAVPDLFIINLGINDMHYNSRSLYEAKQTADTFISQVNAVITSLRTVDANIKVAICMTIPPNVNPWGFGAASTNIIPYDAYRIANMVLCEKLIDEFDYRQSEGLYLIPINACLDTQYNMPTSEQLPNSRASEEIQLPSSAGNVHPNSGGYYQIADEIYAFLCATFKTS